MWKFLLNSMTDFDITMSGRSCNTSCLLDQLWPLVKAMWLQPAYKRKKCPYFDFLRDGWYSCSEQKFWYSSSWFKVSLKILQNWICHNRCSRSEKNWSYSRDYQIPYRDKVKVSFSFYSLTFRLLFVVTRHGVIRDV